MIRSLIGHSASPPTIFIVCFDDLTRDLLEKLSIPGVVPIALRDIEAGDDALVSCKANRTAVEYLWTTTPTIILRVLERNPEIDVLTYLDADLFFFSSPEPIYQELGSSQVLIHEHRFSPRHAHLEKNGRFNVGLLCFRNSEAGLEVVRWWRERCIEWCYAHSENGKMGDQGYLTDWPTRFSGITISQHLGVGTAPWNQEQYNFAGSSTCPTVNGQPIVFFHFHSFQFIHPFLAFPADAGYRTRLDIVQLTVAPYLRELHFSFQLVTKVDASFNHGMSKASYSIDPAQVILAVKELIPALNESGISHKHLSIDEHWECFYPEGIDFIPAQKSPSNSRATSRANSSSHGKYRCLFINTYYDAFLERYYLANPHVAALGYQEQLADLQAQAFGDSSFYSDGMRAAGWEAENLIVNSPALQAAWAGENMPPGRALDLNTIMLEQVRRFAPDVIYCQDMHGLNRQTLAELRNHTSLIAGQIASSAGNIPFDAYDVLVSSFEQFIAWFRELGIISYYQPLAFDPSVLSHITNPPFLDRPITCSFVGSLSSRVHKERALLLDTLAAHTPIQFWGMGIQGISPQSPIVPRYQGEAWGLSMFDTLSRSKLTVNVHGEVTGCRGPMVANEQEVITTRYANNMRLFEATGCGALLITDHKDNLGELFEVGKEIVTYRSPEECVELVNYYSTHSEEAARIAAAGQQRTLTQHTYTNRLAQTAELLSRLLDRRQGVRTYAAPDLRLISYDYKPISANEVSKQHTSAWQDSTIPDKQRALVESELESLYKGKAPTPFAVATELLKGRVRNFDSVLEIGCSSGYYYEALEYLLNRRLNYTGVDYSPGMVAMAKELYPKATFEVADGAALPFPDKSFRIVISGCVLLHVPNYDAHIRETVRVSSDLILVHRTPVCRKRATHQFLKKAYGVETVELRFSEHELIGLFYAQGARLVTAVQYNGSEDNDEFDVSYLLQVG